MNTNIDPMQSLINEFQLWLDANPELPRECAEQLTHHDLTPAQQAWLSDFIVRWKAALHNN